MTRKQRSRRPPDEGPLLQLVYYGYLAGSLAARLLPERAAYAGAEIVGRIAARTMARKAAVVERNLQRVTGLPPGSHALKRIVRDAFASYARYWLETFRLVRAGEAYFNERFLCEGREHLEEALGRGRGAVVVIGHLGNWDAAGAWAAATGHDLVTVAEVLRPRRLFEFFAANRARLGMRILPAEHGVTFKLVEAVQKGAVVAILGDRDLRGRGVAVDFFGAEATLPAGPASIALRAGVPLLVAGVWGGRLPDGRRGWRCEITSPIEMPEGRGPAAVAGLTRVVGEHLERFVARAPEEWHVFQPFWVADRGDATGKRPARRGSSSVPAGRV